MQRNFTSVVADPTDSLQTRKHRSPARRRRSDGETRHRRDQAGRETVRPWSKTARQRREPASNDTYRFSDLLSIVDRFAWGASNAMSPRRRRPRREPSGRAGPHGEEIQVTSHTSTTRSAAHAKPATCQCSLAHVTALWRSLKSMGCRITPQGAYAVWPTSVPRGSVLPHLAIPTFRSLRRRQKNALTRLLIRNTLFSLLGRTCFSSGHKSHSLA